MTYGVGLHVAEGLVMISDSRTTAGVDQVSRYSKMWQFGIPGEKQFILCSAGNLATTQHVVGRIQRDIDDKSADNLLSFDYMSDVAAYIGQLSLNAAGADSKFPSSFLLAGEIGHRGTQLFLIYPEGNYIASAQEIPFLQIGETKYGKPILDRAITQDTPLERAALCGLISMDATMKSNLTVAPPIEVSMYPAGSLQTPRYLRLEERDDYLQQLRKNWNSAMRDTLASLETLPWTRE